MAGDSNYADVSLHLPFNGPAGSTTHFDRGPTQKALTNSVGTALNAAQSKYNGTSLYLNGTNDTLSTASHADFNFGTGDFTIELWVYGTRTNQPHSFPRILANGAYLAANAWNLVLISSSGALFFDTYNGSAANGSSIGTLVENSWNHIAVTRQSGTLRTFLNGALVTTKTDTQSLSGAYTTYVGSDTISFFKGYIDDLRITKGVARYTSNFTPVENQIGGLDIVDPFYSNTSLLINADTTILADQSPVVKTITKVGNADVSFLNSKAGLGSIYFDGTGDYLTIPDSSDLRVVESDFTIEAWVYTTVNNTVKYVVRKGSSTYAAGFVFGLNASGKPFIAIGVSSTDEVFLGSSTVPVNTWTHIAASKSGSTIRVFVNGVVDATGSLSGSPVDNTEVFYVGRDPANSTRDWSGYIDMLRVTKGIARYTAAFTPPNYSLSNYIPTSREDPFFSNVGLLLPFDGANNGTSFFDRSLARRTATRLGNTITATDQSKFNGSSGFFDGSGDYLTFADDAAFKFGSQDFTMELWVRPWTDLIGGQYGGLICKRAASNNQAFALILSGDGAKNTYFFLAGQAGGGATADLCSAPFPAPQLWSHIAVVRKGNQMRLFVNGVGGTPVTLSFTSAYDGNYDLAVGRMSTAAGNAGDFVGHMDDLRVTKGVARYWNDFTPGTAPNPISGLISTDPHLANVKLLVNADQFPVVDKSPSSRALTLSGNAARSLVDSKFGPASLVFDGTNNTYVQPNTPADFITTGDFTIECWIRPSAVTGSFNVFTTSAFAGGQGHQITIFNGNIICEHNGVYLASSGAPITLNVWKHIAFTRSGSSYRVFVDGTQVASTTGTPASRTYDRAAIGALLLSGSSQSNFDGYVDEFRFTHGVARYTSNFTVPTSAYEEYIVSSWQATQGSISLIGQIPAIDAPFQPSQGSILLEGQIAKLPMTVFAEQGSISLVGQTPSMATTTALSPTQLAVVLSGQNPTVETATMSDIYYQDVVLLMPLDGVNTSVLFADYSIYERDVTASGNAQISTAQSKFGGASAKFDGSGDYLSTPDAPELRIAGGDFTIEAWVYRASNTSPNILVQKGIGLSVSEYTLFLDVSGYINFGIGVASDQSWFYSTAASVPLGTWAHIAVTKAGSTIRLFLDGSQLTLGGSSTLSTPTASTAHSLYVGRDPDNPDYDWDGYIDDLRITKGVARYTSSFAAPTSPNPTSGVTSIVYPDQGAIAITGSYAYFGSAPTVTDITVSGTGFLTTTGIQFRPPSTVEVTGRGFLSQVGVYGGANVAGRSFASTLDAFFSANNEFSITGRGFATQLSSTILSASDIMVKGRGFQSKLSAYGSAVVSGRGFRTDLSSVSVAPISMGVEGRGFKTTFHSTTLSSTGINIGGGRFKSELRRFVVRGGGFLTSTELSFEFDASYAQAFVMNLNTSEVTRYTNYPFIHVARIGNTEYGFATDGIYALTGSLDVDARVNGQITTKDTDFNTQDFDGFQSKNVPLVYANTDATIKVTAIVDGVAMPRQTSQFDGRKTKLARGARGRYWAMKVENISKLQGLEFLPEKLQRRVK